MRTPLRRACIPAGVAVLLLAACGGDDSSDTTEVSIGSPATVVATGAGDASTTIATTATTVGPTVSFVDDTTDIPLPPPPGTGDIPVAPPETSDVPVYISVTVGVDDSPARIENVPLGAMVTIDALNQEGSDEFHLQGYELGAGEVMGPGQTATFTFVANQVGDFPLESVTSGDVLLTLHVG